MNMPAPQTMTENSKKAGWFNFGGFDENEIPQIKAPVNYDKSGIVGTKERHSGNQKTGVKGFLKNITALGGACLKRDATVAMNEIKAIGGYLSEWAKGNPFAASIFQAFAQMGSSAIEHFNASSEGKKEAAPALTSNMIAEAVMAGQSSQHMLGR